MKKQVPSKNYVILFAIILLTVLAAFYARNWYIMAREYNSDNSPMLKAISEINPDEIGNYIMENPRFILYTSSGLNSDIKGFESSFKKYVIDKNLSSSMVYINTAYINLDDFNNKLKRYSISNNETNSNDNVTMYIFINGKITKVISDANNLTIKKINSIFKKYGILDNA